MTIKKVLSKVIDNHPPRTDAEIAWFGSGAPYRQRLDLAFAIAVRDQYEHDCVYESKRPMRSDYKLSIPITYGKEHSITVYDIISKDKLVATITVFNDLEYPDYNWRETFADTKYPVQGRPWWQWK